MQDGAGGNGGAGRSALGLAACPLQGRGLTDGSGQTRMVRCVQPACCSEICQAAAGSDEVRAVDWWDLERAEMLAASRFLQAREPEMNPACGCDTCVPHCFGNVEAGTKSRSDPDARIHSDGVPQADCAELLISLLGLPVIGWHQMCSQACVFRKGSVHTVSTVPHPQYALNESRHEVTRWWVAGNGIVARARVTPGHLTPEQATISSAQASVVAVAGRVAWGSFRAQTISCWLSNPPSATPRLLPQCLCTRTYTPFFLRESHVKA